MSFKNTEEGHRIHDRVLLVRSNCSVCPMLIFPSHFVFQSCTRSLCSPRSWDILSHSSPCVTGPCQPSSVLWWCVLNEHMPTDRLLVSVVSPLPFVWDLVAFGSVVVLQTLWRVSALCILVLVEFYQLPKL